MWEYIKGFEGLYSIDEIGNVLNIKRNALISQKINNRGYKIVDLYKKNKRSQLLVHRIVAICFIENKNNYNEVNHIDENKLNNSVENLAWCTHKENMNHNDCIKKVGLRNSKKVKQFSRENVLIAEYNSAMDAQRLTNISNGCISECISGKRKTAGGFKWTR